MTNPKQILSAALAAGILALSAPAAAQEIKIGVLLGFTGPIESLTPDMAASAELAMQEANASGKLLGGATVTPVRADSTCVDAAAATAAAERLITADKVAAIMGADCSGVTIAVANNVAVPNGVPMVSPSATSPALSDLDDNGLFFRTAPSDARQGQVLAEILIARDIKEVAVTFVNNDYGKGLDESFTASYEALGGSVAISAAHEDGKADYSAEVGALSASGAENLAVFGYADGGGQGVIRAAVDADAFGQFIMVDGMIAETLIDAVGEDLEGAVATNPGSAGDSGAAFLEFAAQKSVNGDGPFRAQSYDAAALIMLAMQAAGDDSRDGIQANMMAVANAPGEKIHVGQLDKAFQILADGGEVDYVGATDVEFNEVGGVFGVYEELEVKGGKFETVQLH